MIRIGEQWLSAKIKGLGVPQLALLLNHLTQRCECEGLYRAQNCEGVRMMPSYENGETKLR